MAKIFDVMYPAGEYTAQDGQQKTRWLRCGAVIETQAGKTALKLDCLPVGATSEDGGIWLQLFTPNQGDNRQTAPAGAFPNTGQPQQGAPAPYQQAAPVPPQPAPAGQPVPPPPQGNEPPW